MSIRLPAGITLLGTLLACRLVPTDSGTATADHPIPAVAPSALAQIRAVVDDPLVPALVVAMHDSAAGAEIGRALRAVSRAAADALPSLDRSLVVAREQVGRASAADDQTARAALTLVLDRAGAALAARRLAPTDSPQRSAGP